MKSCAPLLLLATLAGCPPPPVEPREAAAELREDPRRIGTVSRQELESKVTDPESRIGTPATPAPDPKGMKVMIIGIVDTKLCFSVEDTSFDPSGDVHEQGASYKVKIRSAGWSVHALHKNAYTAKAPWPVPVPAASVMVKVPDPVDMLTAVVCVPAPAYDDDSRVLALTMTWESRDRKLAMWELTQ